MPITKIKGKTKDGKQAYRVRVNYTDSDGNYKQVERTAYGSAEAKDLERQLLSQSTAPATPKAITLGMLFEEYKAFKKHEVRIASYDKTDRVLSRYVIPEFQDIALQQITVARLSQWRIGINELGLSLRYRNNIYAEFRALLNYGKKMNYIQSNPVADLGPFKDPNFQMPEEKLQFYTPAEWQRYAAALRSAANTMRGWSIYVFFCIAYYTGMRKGEINALKWSDLNGDSITVRRSLTQKVKGEPFVETPPKTKSSYRTLQLPAPALEVIQTHKARQQKDPAWTADYRICGGPQPVPDTSIENGNKAAAQAAGLHHIRVHDFRHSHASLLINEGINIQEIARRLGHSDVQMTWNTYGHLYPRETERALSVLNRITLTPEE